MYPAPDDVSLLKTEEVVRFGRCEMRSAIIDRMTQDTKRLRDIADHPNVKKHLRNWFEKNKIDAETVTRDKAIVGLVSVIGQIVEAQQIINTKHYDDLVDCKDKRISKVVVNGEGEVACPFTSRELKGKLKDLKKLLGSQLDKKLGRAQELRQYLDVAAIYDFEFEITEQNHAKGGIAFKLPQLTKTVDVDASAALLLTRKGKRTFKTQDSKWGKLISSEKLCTKASGQNKNVLHPLGGSIGVERVVATFIDLIDQGGSKESFVDALIFTTDVSGGVNASIKISPVADAFRLVSAEGHAFGSRVDVHKLTLSFVFPKQDTSEAIFGVERFDGDLDTPFSRPADWRARYNLCVADGRAREDVLKQLRLTAPEIYCIRYADEFDAQYEGNGAATRVAPPRPSGTGSLPTVVNPPPSRGPPLVAPQRRPNTPY